MLAVVFLALDLAKAAVTGELAGVEFWIFILVAEYAATNRTLPPREVSSRKAAGASVRR
jgi:hypothetical protein